MEIKKVEFDALTFCDLQGKVRQIRGCPLTKLEELAAVKKLLDEEIKTASKKGESTSVQYLFHFNSFFAQMCLRALELCNLSPDWVDLNMMAQLLFPFSYEGHVVEGLLIQLNFPSTGRTSTDETQQEQVATSWHTMLASLWVSTKNLQNAMELADSVPWSQLSKTIDAKSKMTNPASREEEDNLAIAKAYAQHMQGNAEVDSVDPDSEEWKDINSLFG